MTRLLISTGAAGATPPPFPTGKGGATGSPTDPFQRETAELELKWCLPGTEKPALQTRARQGREGKSLPA